MMVARAWQAFQSQRAALMGLVTLGVLVLLSLAAPAIAPQNPADPLGFDPLEANHPPTLSWTFLLGTDGRGRSVLALLLWGGRLSLALGSGAALGAALVGLLLGSLTWWRGGLLDPLLSRLMDLCQAVPPLLVLLVLASQFNGVPAPLLVLALVATGWVAPARLTRAAVAASRSALYVDAARAVGVGGLRLVVVHLLPDALTAVASWVAAGAAIYVALEAGLDFLGLGLPPDATSWGTALVGAQDALATGNWWWMTCGGAALAVTTVALSAVARGVATALDPPAVIPVRQTTEPQREPEHVDQEHQDITIPVSHPALGDLWPAWRPQQHIRRPRPPIPAHPLAVAAVVVMLLGVVLVLDVQARGPSSPQVPSATMLQRHVLTYPQGRGGRSTYIGTALYVATTAVLSGHPIPWAAWGSCPTGFDGARCARSEVTLYGSNGQARAEAEGSTFVCTPQHTWKVNPMAGAAETDSQGCGPLGPELSDLGTTAGQIAALLPDLTSRQVRVVGQEAVAGRRCWLLAVGASGRVCVDAITGRALRVERLDRAGRPVASCMMEAISFATAYGFTLDVGLFRNPIPGGHGPLLNGLTQPLTNIQAADDQTLFSALVPTVLPVGVSAQTPTFDSFYDATRGYAPQQRVRQAYQDRRGRVVLVLIETLPRSAWDVTPAQAQAHHVVADGQRLLVWLGQRGQPTLLRVELNDAAVLLSSRVLSLHVLERVAAGLQ